MKHGVTARREASAPCGARRGFTMSRCLLIERLVGERDRAELLAPMRRWHAPRGRSSSPGSVLRANFWLLLGMVRANQPARAVAGMSHAALGALGTAAFALTSQNIWSLADNMSVLPWRWTSVRDVTNHFDVLESAATSCALEAVEGALWVVTQREPRPAGQPQTSDRHSPLALLHATGCCKPRSA